MARCSCLVVIAGCAKAQAWTTPQFIGNGAATAVATNGTGTAAVAANGDALAVWAYRSTNTYIPNVAQAAFYPGGHWGSTVTLSSNVYGSVYSVGLPSVGYEGSSRATVVWEQMAANASTPCTLMAKTGAAASAAGTFVVASGDAAFVRVAGSSNWQKTTFTNGVTGVDAASGQAIVSMGPQVYVSTSAIP